MDPETAHAIVTEYEPPPVPDIEHIVTEDDEPVDNPFSEKQQRLLVAPLYEGWDGPSDGRPFIAAANVGVFSSPHLPAVVPDAFLSLDVGYRDNLMEKRNRAYFIWEFGKPPDVAIEIVSNKKGRETEEKKKIYARMGVTYYGIFDPLSVIQPEPFRLMQLMGRRYVRMARPWIADPGLGLTLWDGVFERKRETWLRWCDAKGVVIPTGKERADAANKRAKAASKRTNAASERANAATQKAQRLAARLKELGIDPDTV